MPTINLARVANNPRFAQAYTVNRSTGTFQQGGFVSATTAIPFYGIVQPVTEETLAQMPEGDRATGMIEFISQQPMYKTRAGSSEGLGDTVTYQGQDYRVVAVWGWGDYGFVKAVAARLSGE
jgi:hypothetical protein